VGEKIDKLTAKQAEFVRQYLVDLNATQAAIRAGYSEATARNTGHKLVTKGDIQEALVELREELTKKGKIASIDEILEGYTNDLRFDPRKLYDDTGTPISPHGLDDDTAMALAGMDVTEKIVETATKEGSNTVSFRNTKYKYPDKKGIRDSLARIHGLFNDKLSIGGDKDEPISINITLNRA
jgi:phage terminase small subunit